ncbi:MAG: hypothetical protein IPK00_26160 [Deltaproteobacteria bacterium]|nr:hypothetical protein [Deltaproteobacteria bacterium]
MKRNLWTLFVAGSLALASAPAFAADAPPRQQPSVRAQEQRLESGYRTLAMHGATSGKLGAVEQARVARQRHEIKDLIRRLEAGEQVAPSQIDRVLEAR